MKNRIVWPLIALLLIAAPVLGQTPPPTPSPDAVPEPVALVSENGHDILNVLLLGSDTTNPNNAGRTDVLLIVSINRTAGTVALLSLPRDLYVYIPDYQVYRINTAYAYGEQQAAGQGAATLIATIRYNLGLEIDHWARVDFTGFRRIVDDLGGVPIPVDCGIQDWRLIDPARDPQLEESWELFTLPVGVHVMDGELALWYARSRRTSSDFDRGRRHQALIRGLWQRVRELSLIDQLRDLWPQVLETVATDLTLDELLTLAPLALSIDTSRLASYTFRPNVEVFSWRSPEGSSVQALHREAAAALMQAVLTPPTAHQLVREGATIEIVNASGDRDLPIVAADRLGWEGFVPTIGENAPSVREMTRIYDYSGQTKNSSLAALQAILRVSDDYVIIEPSGESAVDFRVELGTSYYACTHNVLPPEFPNDKAGA